MAESLTAHVAAEVRAEIERQNSTQRQVGEILGISQPQVSARLRGKIAFNTEELGKLAAAWAVPVATFLPAGERVA